MTFSNPLNGGYCTLGDLVVASQPCLKVVEEWVLAGHGQPQQPVQEPPAGMGGRQQTHTALRQMAGQQYSTLILHYLPL